MLILTVNYVPGKEIEALGLVKGNVVQSKNIGKDIHGGVQDYSRRRDKELYRNAR